MAMEPFDSTKPVFESPSVSSEMRNNLLALHNGDIAPLRPRASNPLAMTVYVNPSLIEDYWLQVWHGFETPLNFAGGDSPVVVEPTVNPRIDLLTINAEGTLAWTEGEENAAPVPPDCPEDVIPICYIYCKTTMTKICNFEDTGTYPNDGYIYQDIRPFLNLGSQTPEWIPMDPTLKSEFYEDFFSTPEGVYLWSTTYCTLIPWTGAGGIALLRGNGTWGFTFVYYQTDQKPFLAANNPTITIRQAQFGGADMPRRFGLTTAVFQFNDQDGIYFRHALSGNYFGVCRSGGVESTVDTGIAAALGEFHDLKMVVTGTTSVKVYIDGVLKGTITTNIPAAAMFICADTGHTSVDSGMYLDYIHIIQDR